MSEDNYALEVYALATEVFGDSAKSEAWLRRPNRALRGAVPAEFLDTAEGRQAVRDVLGRLAYGISP